MALRRFSRLAELVSLFKSYVNKILLMAEALSTNGYGNLHSREASSATQKEVAHG